MFKKCAIWLVLLIMCMVPTEAFARLIGACWDDTNSKVVEINPADGSINTIGLSGFAHLNSLAKDDAGRLFSVGGATNNQLIRINPSTGQGAAVATLNFGADPVDVRGLAFSPTGTLYAINCRPGSGLPPHDLFRINMITGVGTKINSTPLGGIQSITFSAGGILYGWDVDLGLLTINTATGAVTDINPAIGGTYGIQGIAFTPDGTLYGAGRMSGENDKLFLINQATGAYTLVGEAANNYDVRGIEFIPILRRLPAIYLLLLD